MSEPQEPSRPLRVLSLALAMFIVATALVWLSRENGPPPYVPVERPQAREKLPERDDSATPEPPPSDATVRAEALDALPEMPEPTAPLSEQIAVLEQRALAGDPAAGCRLLSAVARCAVTDADGFCTQLQARDLPSASAVLEATQPWMSPRQKVLAAMMQADGSIARLGADARDENRDPIYPQFLADHAYEFLLEGFRANDPLALEGLALVHAPAGGNGLALAMPNPRLYVFYTGVLDTVFGPDTLTRAVRERVRAARAALPLATREELDRQIATEAALWRDAVASEVLVQRWQRLQRHDVRLEDCAP